MTIQTLSILIPCFNEEKTVVDVLAMVVAAQMIPGINKEIILIDDGSSDGTPASIQNFVYRNPGHQIKLITHEKNMGKGACIKSGLQQATGEVLIIQDSD